MVRVTLFVITLLLAAGAADPSGPWLVAVAVLSGLSMLGQREYHVLSIAVFVISLLLLEHTIGWDRGWLVAMAALSGTALLLRATTRIERLRRIRRRWISEGDWRWLWDWD